MTDILRLQARVRSDDAANLFVRLSPSTVVYLRDRARQTRQHDLLAEEGNRSVGSSRWSLVNDQHGRSPYSQSGVEFLPLLITNERSDVTVYASFNGGEILSGEASGKESDVIELPRSLFSCLSGADDFSNLAVSVTALASVEHAEQLFVEPVTVEDWELLQLEAAWLEGGGLLSQVSIVYPNQVLPLLLTNGSDRARVRVLPGPSFERKSAWLNEAGQCPCLCLMAETEFVIKPKLRKAAEGEHELRLRTLPCREDYSGSMLQLAEALAERSPLISVRENTIVLHPATLSELYGMAKMDNTVARSDTYPIVELRHISTLGSASSESLLVAVAQSTFVSKDCIVVHPLLRLRIHANRVNSTVSVRLLSENERRLSRLRRSDISDNAKISLQCVSMRNTVSLSTWRMPDIHGNFRRSVKRNRNSKSQSLSDVLTRISSWGATPCQIGGYFYMESRDSETGENTGLCRIVLDAMSVDQRYFAKKFVLPCDFKSFISLPPSGHEKYGHEAAPFGGADAVMDVPHSVALASLLPYDSLLPETFQSFIDSTRRDSVLFVYGERGTGKTHTALTLAAVAERTKFSSTVYLDCRKLRNSRTVRMKTVLAEIEQIFREARMFSASVVILDDLDELIPSFGESFASEESAHAQQVNPVEVDQAKLCADVTRHLLYSTTADQDLTVVITCRTADSMSTVLLSDSGLSKSFITTPPFDSPRRASLLHCMLRRYAPERLQAQLPTFGCFGEKSTGFRPRDVEQVALRVYKNLSLSQWDGEALESAVSRELKTFVPLARIGIANETLESTNWSDIGGLFQAKAELVATVLRPSRYRRIYEKAQIRLPRGILLYGYPGTGKSMCVPALAKECGFPLIQCRGPEILSKYIGESEAKVRELFARAACAAPSILFFDELDSLAPRRGSDHTGVTDRVVNQLLTYLDGVEDTSQSGQVYVIAATSRPDKVDPALLRPGRLEKHVFVGFAEDRAEWTDLLTKISSCFKVDAETHNAIVSGRLLEKVESQSDSFRLLSAADLNAVFSSAQLAAVHEALAAGQTHEPVSIRSEHLLHSFRKANPSLHQKDYLDLRSVYAAYNSKLRPGQSAADMASGTNASHALVEHQRIALR